MDRTFLAAAAVTLSSLAGYAAGVVAPYPGREASLAGLMIGLTLAAVTHGRGADGGTVTGGTAGRTDGGGGETADAGGGSGGSAADGGERR